MGQREVARFNWSRQIGRFQNVLEHRGHRCVCAALFFLTVFQAGFHGDDTSKQNRDKGLLSISLCSTTLWNGNWNKTDQRAPTSDRRRHNNPTETFFLKRGNIVKRTKTIRAPRNTRPGNKIVSNSSTHFTTGLLRSCLHRAPN